MPCDRPCGGVRLAASGGGRPVAARAAPLLYCDVIYLTAINGFIW